jgi:ribosomal protein S18 acetylase RimI-like enzyme
MTVDDLVRGDLEQLRSWNSATHVVSVASYLDRREREGDVEYLVVRDDLGEPVCKGAIDYAEHPGAGTIVQVGTRAGSEGRGIATMLMAEAERRIAARGLLARLGVEPGNERARQLYDRLGYVAVGQREVGWDHEHPDGTIGWYSTTIIEMEKVL